MTLQDAVPGLAPAPLADATTTPRPPDVSRPVGTHVQVGKNLVDGALRTAVDLGCEAIQVFCGNPRGWALSEGDPGVDRRFRDRAGELGMRVFIHTPYLVNPGSPTPATYERSLALIAHNLRRAVEIGAEGVVVHTGSYVEPAGDDPDAAQERHRDALRRLREGLLPILDDVATDDAPWLLLEPTAGQGRSLCAKVEDLAAYLGALDMHPKAGVCLDTCHVFAAGEPLDEPGGTTDTVDRLVQVGGEGRLRLIHANDSKDVRGAFKDRHEKIGQGHIGTAAFAELFAHPATAGVPFILETPGSRGADDPDIALLKQLRDASAGG
ncbi:deoxyribonuclease IV [Nocardioides faecalis]|uniref:deoxyribonuclease IV n=1 Tax=Nocardioides faecalis TaxID=2803858 RepID=UPI0027DCA230|nr:deoxyribonuclease IV [Nocardioides faecalis]